MRLDGIVAPRQARRGSSASSAASAARIKRIAHPAGIPRILTAVNIFCGRRKHLVKVLCWDGTGFLLLAKRLARGTFSWPEPDDDRKAVELRPDELSALLGGVDLRKTTWRPWWRRPQTAAPPPPVLPARPTRPALPAAS